MNTHTTLTAETTIRLTVTDLAAKDVCAFGERILADMPRGHLLDEREWLTAVELLLDEAARLRFGARGAEVNIFDEGCDVRILDPTRLGALTSELTQSFVRDEFDKITEWWTGDLPDHCLISGADDE